jgi:hypothetical protein
MAARLIDLSENFMICCCFWIFLLKLFLFRSTQPKLGEREEVEEEEPKLFLIRPSSMT